MSLEDSDEFEVDLNDTSSEDESELKQSDEDFKLQDEEVLDDDDIPPTQEDMELRRQENIRALQEGNLEGIERRALLPRLLYCPQAALKQPFKSPHPNAPAQSLALKRALVARKQFVPWGANKPFKPVQVNLPQQHFQHYEAAPEPLKPAPAVELPPGIEPLVLWEPPPGSEGKPVIVDNALTRFLRPHQREGVQFMFECVAGLKPFDGCGCILADDMGLGKTLQGISLLWTLLNNGHEALGGDPLARRIVICCPTSLVSNWDNECTKWLNGRVKTIPLQESSRDDVISAIDRFLAPSCPAQLLIASYETFRIHAERFKQEGTCDLLICDEAHRLKNDATLTNQALASMACKRRVLLSGTPMQNQLQEFYAMVNFCNPGVLGTPSEFRRHYENPILAGREPDASNSEEALGKERSDELSNLVNDFILRRTNSLLSAHLPPKVVEVVCCRMTPLQYDLYCHYVQSRSVQSLFSKQKSAKVLSAITSIRKLLNHPKLIYDMVNSSGRSNEESGDAAGFENCAALFPAGMFDGGRGGKATMPANWEAMSGKFALVARMLALLREQTKDRVVIVSNFTQTLDLFTQLCRERGYPVLRLDGSTTIKQRQKLVKMFNDPQDNQFVFLLSSKAGGCGLNLIGGNRLILFDMSWNPADDKQAAARVWRDGQRRRVYVYRLMTTGTIEEKIYQRQISKEGLQQVVDSKGSGSKASSNLMSMDELRDLFSYDPDTLSTTYDHMVANQGRHKRKKDKVVAGKGGKSKGGGKKASKRKTDMWCSDLEEEDDGIINMVDDSDMEEQLEEMNVDRDDGDEDKDDEEEDGGNKAYKTSAEVMVAGGTILKQQDGEPKEEDLAAWGHHSDCKTVPDDLMQMCGEEDVSFVFSCKVKGRDVDEDAPLKPLGQGGPPVNHGGGLGGGNGLRGGLRGLGGALGGGGLHQRPVSMVAAAVGGGGGNRVLQDKPLPNRNVQSVAPAPPKPSLKSDQPPQKVQNPRAKSEPPPSAIKKKNNNNSKKRKSNVGAAAGPNREKKAAEVKKQQQQQQPVNVGKPSNKRAILSDSDDDDFIVR